MWKLLIMAVVALRLGRRGLGSSSSAVGPARSGRSGRFLSRQVAPGGPIGSGDGSRGSPVAIGS